MMLFFGIDDLLGGQRQKKKKIQTDAEELGFHIRGQTFLTTTSFYS